MTLKKFIAIALACNLLLLGYGAIRPYNEERERALNVVSFTVLSPHNLGENIITSSYPAREIAVDGNRTLSLHMCTRTFPRSVEPPEEAEEFIVPSSYDECVPCEIAGRPGHIYRIGLQSQMICAVSAECCLDFVYFSWDFTDDEVVAIIESLEYFQ